MNALKLNQYLNWLESVINYRINHVSVSFDGVILHIPKPVFQSDNIEEPVDLFESLNLQSSERIVCLLAIAPYVAPWVLNGILKNEQYRNIMALSTSSINHVALPTIETALFVLAGKDISKRAGAMKLMDENAPLFIQNLVKTPPASAHDPYTTLRILPGFMLDHYLVKGQTFPKESFEDFPAELLETSYEWEDLILPYDTMIQVKEVRDWVTFEEIVKKNGDQSTLFKKGCKTLFHGPSGTGKTMAAALLGKVTGKKVYRIDLSAVVSKYIGETEKNLARIFNRAGNENWILFFDEADALFGKRGKTKNAHDRYANQEVAYLLQRFESYEGLSILASNLLENIDTAFYRRFNNIVHFKKPEADERLKLWQNNLPKDYLFEDQVDLDEIAHSVNVTGAAIHNIMHRSYMKAVLRGEKVILGTDMYDSLRLEKSKEGQIMI
jgi:hypothetical protein